MDGETFAIAGGADHKTGQVDDPARCYTEVEAWLTRLAPDARHRTLVRAGRRNGRLPADYRHRRRAAIHRHGVAGNGMTFGLLAAVMALMPSPGHQPLAKLFEIDRSVVSRGPWKLPDRERRLSLLSRSRSIRWREQALAAIDPPQHWRGRHRRRPDGRRAQERERKTRHAFTNLHSSWLSRAVERDGPHVGMPVPWLPIPADRGGHRGPRRAPSGAAEHLNARLSAGGQISIFSREKIEI